MSSPIVGLFRSTYHYIPPHSNKCIDLHATNKEYLLMLCAFFNICACITTDASNTDAILRNKMNNKKNETQKKQCTSTQINITNEHEIRLPFTQTFKRDNK